MGNSFSACLSPTSPPPPPPSSHSFNPPPSSHSFNPPHETLHEKLKKCTYENTRPFQPNFTHCTMVRVYDGDTLHVVTEMNGTISRFMIRMLGYDSPELKSKNPEERRSAQIAKEALENRIKGKLLRVEIDTQKKDKYGRIIATLYDDLGNINQWMMNEGYGYYYQGGTKKEFVPEIVLDD